MVGNRRADGGCVTTAHDSACATRVAGSSAVRHILTVGAQASLGAAESDHAAEDFSHAQIELGVNAAVVIALVIGLVLVWRSERVSPDSPETDTTQGLA